MQCERTVANWLMDAYQAEQSIMFVLESHLNDIDDDEIRARLEDEINSTSAQAEMIKGRIEELDREILPSESDMITWIKNAENVTFSNENDKSVRFTLMEYTLEYFERATIKSVAIAAEQCNDHETIALCQKILGDELQTAEELDRKLFGVVTNYLNKETIEKEDIDWDEGQF